MLKITLLIPALFIGLFHVQAQHVLTDVIDLGEDRSSHNYQEYGSVSMGNYVCNGDSAITIGANNQNDSIVFDMVVRRNTQEVIVRWNYSWFNAGSSDDQFSNIIVEDRFEDTLKSPGANAIGSHPVSCDIDSHQIVFSNMSSHTTDGSIKIKIYDPYPAFAGNSSICRVEVYSDTTGLSSRDDLFKQLGSTSFKTYPNPIQNRFMIESKAPIKDHISIELFDMIGRVQDLVWEKQSDHILSINAGNIPSGIYFIAIRDNLNAETLYMQKVIKE